MTQNEIIEMAAICGIIPWTKHEYIGGNRFSPSDDGLDGDIAALIQFAKMVEDRSVAKERAEFAVHAVDIARRAVAKEREACLKLCERNHFAIFAAKAIRARGQE